MKKIILFMTMFLLMGCHSIPSGEVNSYLNKYQSLDNEVVNDLDNLINNSNYPEDILELYKNVYLRQYKDLKYKINDYECSSNYCTVPVDIEIYDYNYAQQLALEYLTKHEDEFNDQNGNYDINLYTKYKLDVMNNITKRIKYTININLEKELYDWRVIPLNNIDLLKIHGIYE